MSTSESAWLALIVALASGAGAFGGAAFSTWAKHRADERAYRRDQQRRDASVLGPVMSYLVDANPQRLTFNARPNPDEQTAINTALQTRRDRLIGELMVLAAGHPDAAVRESCRDLSVALHNSFSSAIWAVRDLLGNSGASETTLATASGDYDSTQRIAERLLVQVAAYGSGKRTPKT